MRRTAAGLAFAAAGCVFPTTPPQDTGRPPSDPPDVAGFDTRTAAADFEPDVFLPGSGRPTDASPSRGIAAHQYPFPPKSESVRKALVQLASSRATYAWFVHLGWLKEPWEIDEWRRRIEERTRAYERLSATYAELLLLESGDWSAVHQRLRPEVERLTSEFLADREQRPWVAERLKEIRRWRFVRGEPEPDPWAGWEEGGGRAPAAAEASESAR